MRWLGSATMILGGIILAVAALADVIGLGQPGFGPRQALGAVLGIVVIWFGYRWRRLIGAR